MFTPNTQGSRGGGFTGFTYRTQVISNASSVTLPATVENGDLGILIDFAAGSPVPTEVTPTGWTNIKSVLGGYASAHRGMISYKILTAAEASTSVTGMNGNLENGKSLLVFASPGLTAVTPSSTVNLTMITGNPGSQTVLAGTSGTAPLVVIGICAEYTSLRAFSTASPAFDAEVTNNVDTYYIRVGYKIYNTSPADHTVDMNDHGNNNFLGSFYLEGA